MPRQLVCVPSQEADPPPAHQGRLILRTVGQAIEFILALPHAEANQRRRRAVELILAQADVASVSHQVHLALFYDTKLDIGAVDV